VPVVHLNDSKIPLGGRVDRHEHIGQGKIGAEAFARILRHPRFGTTPPEGLLGRVFLLETPIDEPGDDRRNVATLWDLAGLKDQAPEAEKGFSMLTPAIKKIQEKTAKREASEKRKLQANSKTPEAATSKKKAAGKSKK
jgi:Xylose isomerase-like TIM barrel